jgi:hypothetical protein
MSDTPESLYARRTRRVMDAVQLRIPDRVPCMSFFSFFAARYGGLTCEEAMYDYEKLHAAARKAIIDFEPDMFNNSFPMVALGPIMEIMGCRSMKWPGGGLPPDVCYQFVEKEYMKAEEYDDLIFDPTGFMWRQLIPRHYGALEPLQQIPPLPALYYTRFMTGTAAFASPGVSGALAAW